MNWIMIVWKPTFELIARDGYAIISNRGPVKSAANTPARFKSIQSAKIFLEKYQIDPKNIILVHEFKP